MPKIRYETIATIDMETKFTGEITPVPTVLIYIMTPLELKVITTIMQETYLNGRCLMTMKEMSIRFNCTYAAVQTVLSNLRRRSILLEEPSGNGGAGKNRMLNFKAIQHINDLVQGEDPGVYARIKSIIIRRDILTLTKEDIRKGYDNKVLPPGHDPVEEEEYD